MLINNTKKNWLTVLLILGHFLILEGLYVGLRYDLQHTHQLQDKFMQGNLQANIWNYFRLYFSNIGDETYYYEWSTVTLGKSFEENYPLAKQAESPVASYFFQTPKLRIPYVDIPSEYPPLLILPLLLIRSISSNYLQFCYLFAFCMNLIYFLSVYLCYRLILKLNLQISLNRLLSYSLLSILLLGQIFVVRLDIIPALLFLWAVYCFIEEKYWKSALLITLGFYTKGFSIILFPYFFILLYKNKKNLLCFTGTFFISFMFISFALHFLTHGQYWHTLQFHQERGIQVESLYSLVPHLANILNLDHIFTWYSHFSIEMRMRGQNILIFISKYLPFIIFGIIYGIAFRNPQKTSPIFEFKGSILLLLSFILTFKVFSPQFLIWIIPVLFLSIYQKNYLIIIFMISLFLTHLLYPKLYFLLSDGFPLGSYLLILRNALLIYLWIILFKNWKHSTNTLHKI